jgi:hypothetical protein
VNDEGTDETTVQYTLSTTSAFARAGGGAQFLIKPNLRVAGLGFFDFGFGGKYSSNATDIGYSYPLTSFLRYGALGEFDFNIAKGFWIGAGGSFALGSLGFTSEEVVDYEKQTLTGPYSFSGYSGVIKMGYEF